MSVPTLEDLCCQFVCDNSNQFPNGFMDELNLLCLDRLVKGFSMYDILKREQYLEEKGFDTRPILNNLLINGFACKEARPIRSIECPHFLNMFQGIGLQCALSNLLSQHLFKKAVDLYMLERKDMHASLAKLQEDCDFLRFFRSQWQLNKEPYKLVDLKLSHDALKEMFVFAAKKIVNIVLDEHLCAFLVENALVSVIHTLCQSLVDVYVVVLRRTPHLHHILSQLIKLAKNLSRICISARTPTDMEYLDDVLSMCSGVNSFKSKGSVKAEPDLSMASESLPSFGNGIELESTQEFEVDATFGDEPGMTEGSILSEGVRSECESQDFDLMDDAVLLGSVHNSTNIECHNGMPRADIKISNLREEKYIAILEHHFTSWLSLTELHLKVPQIQHRMMASLCLIVSRPSFKSLQISNAVFTLFLLDDLLSCIASRRKSCPLDKLMLVSVSPKEKTPGFHNFFPCNHLDGMSEGQIKRFVKRYQSQRIASEGSFQGTKLLEIFGGFVSLQAECLVMQYILADTAMTRLCLRRSITDEFLRTTIHSLSHQSRKLTQVILQDWNMSRQEDCDALVRFLDSISSSLEVLNLAGCFRFRKDFSLEPVVEAISSCKSLRSLDLSENSGKDALLFVNEVVLAPDLEELCLRWNNIDEESGNLLSDNEGSSTISSVDLLDQGNVAANWQISRRKYIIENILAVLASRYELLKHQLTVVDLRENLPDLKSKVIKEVFNPELVRKVAKRVLYDKWFGGDDS